MVLLFMRYLIHFHRTKTLMEYELFIYFDWYVQVKIANYTSGLLSGGTYI